jgi:hypothetical protein
MYADLQVWVRLVILVLLKPLRDCMQKVYMFCEGSEVGECGG